MKCAFRGWVAALALAGALGLLSAVAGCGGWRAVDSSTTQEATVHGKVTLDGKPVTQGQVVFNPANARRKLVPLRSAPIGPDGTFTVTTLTGSNSVMVNPKREGSGKPKLGAVPARMIPLDVKPGDNTFNIELSTQGPSATTR